MNTVIIFISLAVVTSAAPQYGGGSAGGLLGHHQPLEHHIIGLSRGEEEAEHYGGVEEAEHYGGVEEGGHGGYEAQSYHNEKSIGFTGSDFNTPVDVHHEKEIHIKAKPEYHYDYHVADHKHKDFKSKHETRDGYKVKGTYSLLEPDHKTIRVVDYVSDKKLGFIAKVSYKKYQ
ncbi:adult-specific cuticular protein ACP-22-like [Leptinotarsa decemlineata]|uniref:adult-specific cuticular protein ACP-22-like n=1 Tax=Leptinotarsa decemlineata TaxID=7539 RepID=UPI003D30D373